MLPSTCVPYKHHPAQTINHSMDAVLEQQRSAYAVEQSRHEAHRSTIGRWLHGFAAHCAQLMLEGFPRLSLSAVASSAQTVFNALKQGFSDSHACGFFIRVQPALCQRYPPLGIFRTLGS